MKLVLALIASVYRVCTPILTMRNDVAQLLLVGDSGVGKSSLLLRFTNDSFEDLPPTIGQCQTPIIRSCEWIVHTAPSSRYSRQISLGVLSSLSGTQGWTSR